MLSVFILKSKELIYTGLSKSRRLTPVLELHLSSYQLGSSTLSEVRCQVQDMEADVSVFKRMYC